MTGGTDIRDNNQALLNKVGATTEPLGTPSFTGNDRNRTSSIWAGMVRLPRIPDIHDTTWNFVQISVESLRSVEQGLLFLGGRQVNPTRSSRSLAELLDRNPFRQLVISPPEMTVSNTFEMVRLREIGR